MAEVVEFRAGDTIYDKGASADFFYVVLEGQISLRLPGQSGVSIQIDELTKGAMFGSCVCFQLADYSLNAQCTRDSKIMKIESATLKELMDSDLLMGYTIQTQISRTLDPILRDYEEQHIAQYGRPVIVSKVKSGTRRRAS